MRTNYEEELGSHLSEDNLRLCHGGQENQEVSNGLPYTIEIALPSVSSVTAPSFLRALISSPREAQPCREEAGRPWLRHRGLQAGRRAAREPRPGLSPSARRGDRSPSRARRRRGAAAAPTAAGAGEREHPPRGSLGKAGNRGARRAEDLGAEGYRQGSPGTGFLYPKQRWRMSPLC
nr:uncharacterized protein LOC106847608 [Equus asinus]